MSLSWPTLRQAAAASLSGFSTVMSWQPVVSSRAPGGSRSSSSSLLASNTGTSTAGSATLAFPGCFRLTLITEILPWDWRQFGPSALSNSPNDDT
jgi:hypothetical protein